MKRLRQEQNGHLNMVRLMRVDYMKMNEVLAACNEICLQTYHKPVQTYETGEMVIAEWVLCNALTCRLGLILTYTEKLIFLSLYYWRDVVAREWVLWKMVMDRNDESVQYILPLLHILHVVKRKPRTLKELEAILLRPSSVVRDRMDRLFRIVEKCLNASEVPGGSSRSQ